MELTENCKRAIAENRCLGCVGLGEKDWIPPKKCPYLPSAEESIKQIKLNLRNGEKMKYEDMLNTITLGDSYELIKDIPDNSIDLVIIDPPYLFDNFGGGCFGNARKKSRKELENIRHGFDYLIINELKRVMKKINIYIFCSKAQLKDLFNIFAEENTDLLVWHKTNPIPAIANNYLSDLEYCFFAREKGVEVHCTYESSSKLYESPMNKKDKEKYKHPTIKPYSLIKNLIKNSSNKGDIVLDCFSGSGTTCAAAKELGRQFIGIEIDPEYYKISLDRLQGILANGQISFDTLAERTKDEI